MTVKAVIKSEEDITKEGEKKKPYKNKSKTMNKMTKKTYILIVNLNVSQLNAPTKRQRMAEWIQKKKKKTCIYAA